MLVPEVQDARDRLDGLMLGDGGLVRYGGGTQYHMMLSKQLVPIKDKSEANRLVSLKEHLKWMKLIIKNVFTPLGVEVCEGHPRRGQGRSRGKPFEYAHLLTRLSPVLTDLYDEWYNGGEWFQHKSGSWYMRGGTKVLPQRLMEAAELPILTLLEWFLGDGSSYWCWYEESQHWSFSVTFATPCFPSREVFHLTHMLDNMGIETIRPAQLKTIVKGSGLTIRLSTTGNRTDRLMRLIQPTMLEMFGDSESPSYKDMIKWKDYPPDVPPPLDFNTLRNRLKGEANHANT